MTLGGSRRAERHVSVTAVDAALDKQNGVTLGRVLGRGTVGHAEEGSDGDMRATVRIPEDELVYEPGVLIMPHGGVLELALINDDKNTHCAVLPSNGDYIVHLAGEPLEGHGHARARRPGLLLVRLHARQRRGPRPDRRDRRVRRHPARGAPRPPAAAAPVVRPPAHPMSRSTRWQPTT